MLQKLILHSLRKGVFLWLHKQTTGNQTPGDSGSSQYISAGRADGVMAKQQQGCTVGGSPGSSHGLLLSMALLATDCSTQLPPLTTTKPSYPSRTDHLRLPDSV
jgi:hypothetical protein